MAGLYTGARYSELADKTVADFHPDSGTIHVPFPKQGRPHNIHLDDAGVAFFERMVAKAKGRLVFTRADEKWGDRWQLARMKAACKAARITPTVGFHTLRHTWASLAVMNGMNFKVVSRQPRPHDDADVRGLIRPPRAELQGQAGARACAALRLYAGRGDHAAAQGREKALVPAQKFFLCSFVRKNGMEGENV